MASFLDISLLQNFSVIFIFILIWAVVYGILSKIKIFGDNKVLHALIALAVGVLVLFSGFSLEMIKIMTPWFTTLFIFGFLMIVMFMMFGAKEGDFHEILHGQQGKGIVWTISIICIVLILAAFGYVKGQELRNIQNPQVPIPQSPSTQQPYNPGQTGQYVTVGNGVETQSAEATAIRILAHPKVLGFIVILLIAMFTILLLTNAPPAGGGGGGGHH
ncbi:hypothetical protein HZB01_04410 [Candidatus Woesearchaeota archaeon]|nr:hypothetical protein [Candidatus Woesearchaeota archaeon]